MAEHYFLRCEAAAAASTSRMHKPWIKVIEEDAPVEEAYELLGLCYVVLCAGFCHRPC